MRGLVKLGQCVAKHSASLYLVGGVGGGGWGGMIYKLGLTPLYGSKFT